MAQGTQAADVTVLDAQAPVTGRGVVRRTLVHALDGVLALGTGLVVGARGAGKTTLMAQWATTCELPVVWGRCSRSGIAVRSVAQAVTLAPDALGDAMLARRTPTVLVLDDVHELVEAGAGAELEDLLRLLATPDVHVLMGTRREPTFTLARSETDPPVVVTGTDLRMRTWEVERLFREVYEHPLTPDDVETLTHETEGWAAAIHLFHRATAGLLPADRRRAVRSLSVDTRYARDYLVGEVLAELGRPLVELLHWGSVFDELTAARFDAVTSGTVEASVPAAQLLHELDRTWSLATTDDGVHYRIPRVLHRHLRAAHTERLGAVAQVWRDRAQVVLANETRDDDDRAAAVVPRPGTWTEFASGVVPSDRRWLGLLRSATRREPEAQAQSARQLGGTAGPLVEGLCLLAAGRFTDAAEPLRRAAEDPDGPQSFVLAASLAHAAVVGGSARSVLRTIDQVQTEADRHGQTWLARLSHGMIVGFDGSVPARAQARRFAADRRADGDAWGAALIETWSALAGLSVGAREPGVWEELTQRWQELDAAVPGAWVRACHALTTAALQLPESRQDARVAEAVARRAGVPGALAFAYAALAATDPGGGAELAELAESHGREIGVDMRPCRAVGLAGHATGRPRRARPGHRPAAADDADAPELRVRCLGEFRVLVDGSPVDLSAVRPRARSALRMLALNAGRPVHREQLADALWAELEPRAALHNLHVSISAVRRALEPQVPTQPSRFVVRDGETYLLALRPGSGCDVDDLEHALRLAGRRHAEGDLDGAAAELRHALDLYRGDLLPEDGPAEWVVGPRERLRLMVADAAATLAQLELDRGSPELAILAAARSIELDECRDHAWRLLVSAYTAAGDAAAAHRATRGYREMLETLGVPGVPHPIIAPPGRSRA